MSARMRDAQGLTAGGALGWARLVGVDGSFDHDLYAHIWAGMFRSRSLSGSSRRGRMGLIH